MENLGLTSLSWLVNARNFNVPQNRKRCIAIFSKIGLPAEPKFRASTMSVRQAFAGLPHFPDHSIQHYARIQSEACESRIRLVPRGGDIRDIAATKPLLVPPSWFKTKGKIVDIWGRLDWDGISNTIRTGFLHPSRGRFIHPVEHRPITFREAARLQTIPDIFLFEGGPEQLARQIGNAVPVNMGRAVAKRVKTLFRDLEVNNVQGTASRARRERRDPRPATPRRTDCHRRLGLA